MIKSNIEELIKSRGLQKKYVAEKLDVSVAQLRNYETNHSFIPIDKAFILADLLGVKVDDLYKRE
jgi:transcriptional regulator with XRE-family HTH domain